MINRLAKTIVNKNLTFFQTFTKSPQFKIIHSFSNNNKKNPFDKFKRSTDSNKKQAKPDDLSQTNKQQQKQQNKPINQSNSFTSNKLKQNVKTQKPVAGFNKFKRDPNFQQKLNLNKQKQVKPQKNVKDQMKNPQQSQKSNGLSQQNVKNPAQSVQKSKQNETTNKAAQIKQLKTEDLKVKGFAKFKKIQTQGSQKNVNGQSIQKSNQSYQSPYQKPQQSQQPQLNTKSQAQLQRQNAYKNTQKKIQEDKQEWEGFFQQQMKKQKQKAQKQQTNQGWKGFDFTNRKSQQGQGKKTQQQARQSFFKPPKTPQQYMKYAFIGGSAIYLVHTIFSQIFSIDNTQIIQTDQMITLLNQGKVRQTWFETAIESLSEQSSRTKKYVCSILNDNSICKSQSNAQFQMEWNRLVDTYNTNVFGMLNQVIKKAPIVKKDNHMFNTVRSILSFALLFMLIRSLMSGLSKGKAQMGKGGGGMSGLFQNSKSHRFKQIINVKFDDVVGMNKAKQQIVQFIDFLKNAQKYNKLGAKIPRGALLTGPPGTGKTMLAKACAGQSGVPFFTISGSQFMEMYVGVGAQRVRNLFTEAKQSAPSIIFIDQIDAVGKKRASGAGGGGNDERDNTLNQLLVQMDGFDQTTNVIVFAATNQKQVLDPALTRPGRFDRLIEVDLPDIQGRKQIFMVHLKPIVLDQKFPMDQYAKRLATLTPGFSGADIKNLCNQAAIIAARNDKKFVSMIDFELASQRIIGGVQKKSTLITPQTKRTVAYHECGHGVVSWFMEHASPLLKLTIIPRSKGALGYAQYLPNQNQVYTRKQLQDQICVILGGRIAQQIFFKKISTGASDDLQKAHKVAKAIIAQYGMGKKLGWLSYSQTQYAKQYSHQTQQKIDEQILQIIYQCSVRTRKIVQQKKQMIQKLAELLLKQQTIDQRMISGVLGQRPFKSSKQYQDYIRQKKKIQQQEQKQPQAPSISGGAAAFKPFNIGENINIVEDLKNKYLKKENKSSKVQILQSN